MCLEYQIWKEDERKLISSFPIYRGELMSNQTFYLMHTKGSFKILAGAYQKLNLYLSVGKHSNLRLKTLVPIRKIRNCRMTEWLIPEL